ncbi:hypothetical protein EVAR_103178_1 [Eumeta japonica]|uniref:Uncharacterized protein n=1 Tax=Eumeta variegata TaxID=151549 RepID=A0A4C1YCA7_EUMVA|nr:hypothetical protein EVAR_103178_1 [Eumeta japonica]
MENEVFFFVFHKEDEEIRSMSTRAEATDGKRVINKSEVSMLSLFPERIVIFDDVSKTNSLIYGIRIRHADDHSQRRIQNRGEHRGAPCRVACLVLCSQRFEQSNIR